MMRISRHIILAILLVSFSISVKAKDIYLVYYATINGKSGHVGIAIDNYKIVIRDSIVEGHTTSKYISIQNNTLTYYDLWPEKDDFNALNVDKNTTGIYYKLPAASWENSITVQSLLQKGIPHEEHYPIDGLIRISSPPQKDQQLKKAIEKLINKNIPFNVRTNNCADFVEAIIEMHCNCSIEAEESIVLRKSTTPNRLYQEVSKMENVTILKDGSEKAKGSFTKERLLKRNNTKP
ncbi:hypothetical protein [Tenacibaculum xiamenense]|uniref:hypothetical protein n=1 Tax=Tenacibaculum xiamenense TaxID=1261553 RepID=UPI00389429DF